MNRDDADSVEDTEIVVEVVPTTGGSFEIKLDATATVEELRWRVARKVQTPRERLTLLSRERVLKTGRLDELEIRDGSRITLIPQLEAGFSTGQQGTEQSVVQAIEQLSEQQVDDFLSGRSPLTLALRVEDHMMFVQLQLEQSERKRRSAKRQSREKADSTDPKIARTQPTASAAPKVSPPKVEKPSMSRLPHQAPPPNASIPGPSSRHPGLAPPVLSPEEWTRYRAELHRFHQMILPGHQPNCIVYPHQMVSELRSLVAEQQRQSVRHHHQQMHHQMAAAAAAHRAATAAQTAKHRGSQAASSQSQTQSKHNQTASASSPPKTTPSTIPSASETKSPSATATSKSTPTPQHPTAPKTNAYPHIPTQPTNVRTQNQPGTSASAKAGQPKIESVTNTGPHVFSGTFSGSLHPSVQDNAGRPRRDPSTIVQILRDLLSTANHQYLPELLRSQNGVMVGRRAIGQTRIRQSIRLGSSSSRHTSSKSSRTSKSSKSSRSSRSEHKPPTIDQNYIQWLQKTRRENDVTRSKMAKLQEQMRERRNRRRTKGVKEDLDGSSSQHLDAETENETTMETLTVGLGTVSPPRDTQSPNQTLNYLSV